MSQSQLKHVLDAIDVFNADDPNTEEVNGTLVSKELLYSQRMSAQMAEFHPQASDELKIAAHAQHVLRWTSARSDYPLGKAGYYRWRTELGRMHARVATEQMAKVGYSGESQNQVFRLLTKQGIKQNEDVQILEDVICLVFIQHYFLPFSAKHSEEKVVDIVQKTWGKMSAAGQHAALKLDLDEQSLALIQKALG